MNKLSEGSLNERLRHGESLRGETNVFISESDGVLAH